MSILIFISLFGFAAEDAVATTTTTVPSEKHESMTIKDAKAQCKEQGKTGKDLVLCIKDLKN